MLSIPALGETAVLRQDPFVREHLWVFVSGLTFDGKAVMFNFTKWKKGCDETCVLNVGDHEFIKCKTIVEYRRGILLTPEKWRRINDRYDQTPSKPVTKEVLKKIQQGALRQDGRTDPNLQDIVRLFEVA